ncbi:uncharacterized protein LOC144874629 [Branchiostoma floridae x Branchiostoma japonicum]
MPSSIRVFFKAKEDPSSRVKMDSEQFARPSGAGPTAESRIERGDDAQSVPTDPDVGEMDNEHRERLRKIGDYIKERLKVRHVLDTLRDKRIFRKGDEGRINATGNNNKQSAGVLLEILPERGPRAYEAFYDALLMCEADDYYDLITKLDSVEVGGAGSQQQNRIQVVIRVRPPQNVGGGQGGACLTVDAQEMKVSLSGKQFYFDKVFPEETTQAELFDTMASPIIDSVLEGYNGCILCYGRTGSGKTFTMEGPPGTERDDETEGIIYRTLKKLFLKSEEMAEWNVNFYARVLEVYNEKVSDLNMREPHKQRQAPLGITLATSSNKDKYRVTSVRNALNVFHGASKNRQSRDTFANTRSSRSHMIFQVVVSILHKAGTEPGRTGELYLVDLAGSEAAGKVNTTAEGLREGANINMSLMYLQQVIGDLSINKQKNFQFRRSTLTMLLKQVLLGNSMTAFIVNVDPSMASLNDTKKSLEFASNAKKVKVKPTINYIPLESLLNKYLKMIAELKRQIETLKRNYESGGAERSTRMTSDVGTDAVNPATSDANTDADQSFDSDRVHNLEDEFHTQLNALMEAFRDEIANQMEGFQTAQLINGIPELLEDFRSQFLQMLSGMRDGTPGPVSDREQQMNMALDDLRRLFMESIDEMVSQLVSIRVNMESDRNFTTDKCVQCCECCKVCGTGLWYWQPGYKWYSLSGKGAGWVVLLLILHVVTFLLIALCLEIRQGQVRPEDEAPSSNTTICCVDCKCTCPIAPIVYITVDGEGNRIAYEVPGLQDQV